MLTQLKFAVWGCGIRGKRILQKIGKNKIAAYIEKNEAAIGNDYEGIPIISYEQYKNAYCDCCIIVSQLHCEEIIMKLKQDGIKQFFLYLDCPAEFQDEHSHISELEEYVKKNFVEGLYTIYGLSLYSLYLKQWITEQTGIEPSIVVRNSEEKELAEFFSKKNSIKFIYNEENALNQAATMLVAVNEDMEALKRKFAISIKEAFDFSTYRIGEDKRIAGLKNLYEGKRGFIIGTGPSLRMEDLDVLHDREEICFSMNGIFHAFDKTLWRPDVFVASDRMFIAEQEELLEELPVKIKLISDFGDFYWKKHRNESMYRYHSCWGLFYNGLPKFSENCSQVVYEVATVTYACIQMAVYMGVKEIYLLGVDFSISGNYKDKGNHFTKDYYASESKTGKFWREQQLRAYISAKQYADKHGIKIYNATRGGALEVFERADFDKILQSK